MSVIMSTPSEKQLIWDRRMAIWDYNNSMSGARKAGIKEGESRLNSLISKLLEENRIDDIRRSAADPEYREKLYRELLPEDCE